MEQRYLVHKDLWDELCTCIRWVQDPDEAFEIVERIFAEKGIDSKRAFDAWVGFKYDDSSELPEFWGLREADDESLPLMQYLWGMEILSREDLEAIREGILENHQYFVALGRESFEDNGIAEIMRWLNEQLD